MKQKVLFLGSGSPFMVNAVLGNLSTAGYDVMSAEARNRAHLRRGGGRRLLPKTAGY